MSTLNSLPPIGDRPCYVCKSNVPETSPRQVLVHHELENSANETTFVFHRSCWIRIALIFPVCHICVRDGHHDRMLSCAIWNQSLGRTGAIEKMWMLWGTIQLIAIFMTAIFPIFSILLTGGTAVQRDNINSVWVLPITILLTVIEFLLRFLGTAALARLLAHAFGFSSLLFYPIYFILSLLISYLLLKSFAVVTPYLLRPQASSSA